MKKQKPDKSWSQRAAHAMAQNAPGTNSKRENQYIQGVYPSHVKKGEKCYLWDAWDNKYIDFIAGLGAISLGYSHPRVTTQVQKAIHEGVSHSLPHIAEVEVAERLKSNFPIDKVRFLKTGSEACAAACRIARSYSNKRIILSRGYHGHNDLFVSLCPPALGVKDQFHIHPYEKPEDLDTPGVAAVIVEGLELELSNRWQSFLEETQKRAKLNNIAFIMDEVITGFRTPRMSVSRLYNLEPDLIILGKGIANGYPLSVVAGTDTYMDHGEYFISSTFSGDAVSLTAAREVIDEIETAKNLDDLLFYGDKLRNSLNELHPDIRFEGYGSRAMLNTTHPTTALFMQEMCRAGFLFGKAWFFHFGHLEENIMDLTLSTAKEVIERIKRGEVKLEGKVPEETFKR